MRTRSLLKASMALLLVSPAACKPPENGPAKKTAQEAPAYPQSRDCPEANTCPEMVSLPGGHFTMGSPGSEKGRFDDEDQKDVAVAPFAIGKYPVTRGQWAAFIKATGRDTPRAACAYAPASEPSWRNPGFPQGDDHPVVCISWPEANAYVSWLSRKTGKSYRLPTDTEWEYAARAGSTTAFPWGPTASHAFANYGENECCAPKTEGRDRWSATSPVGSFPSNAFGLFDMHGNVFEWVATCADELEKLPRPKGAKGCAYRYARGGVYADRPQVMRSAAKNIAPPPGDAVTIDTYRSAGFGLRVARSVK